MLDSEDREWRDAFEFTEEIFGEKVVSCRNCDEDLTPDTGDARLSRDGLFYTKCSICGEETLANGTQDTGI